MAIEEHDISVKSSDTKETRMDAVIETCTDWQELAGADMTAANKKAVNTRTAELTSLAELCPPDTVHGGGGRPSHEPTEQTRALVTLMAGMGANETQIALVVGIARNTLRKHYDDELNSGSAKMDYRVYGAAYKAITQGKTDMIKMYLERRCSGWKPDVPPPITINTGETHRVYEVIDATPNKNSEAISTTVQPERSDT